MTFNFDKVVSRFGTNCAKWDGMAQSMGDDMISLVADMDLPAPSLVVDKVAEGASRHLRIYRSVPALLRSCPHLA